MAKVDITDAKGKKVGSADLPDAVFGIEPNTHAVHLVVRSIQNSRRSGTSETKTRGQVRGGGAKPYRQKGTGRARQGTIRAPQFAGGGVVFGPHQRSYSFRVPNKVVKLAMRSVLSAKAADGALHVLDSFDLNEPSTKKAAAILATFGIAGRVTVVVGDDDVNAIKSLRNLEKVRVITARESNTYDLVDNVALVFTKPALEYVEGVLS